MCFVTVTRVCGRSACVSHDVCAPVEGSPFMEGVCMSVSVSAGEFIFRDVLYGWLDSDLLIWAKGRGWWYRREEG